MGVRSRAISNDSLLAEWMAKLYTKRLLYKHYKQFQALNRKIYPYSLLITSKMPSRVEISKYSLNPIALHSKI
jgi:hypothetical protein